MGENNNTASTEKPKRRSNGRNSPVIGDNGLLVKPGDNAKYTRFGMHLMAMPKIDPHNYEELSGRLADFFQACVDADMKPAVSGLSMAIGLDRRRLWEIANDRPSTNNSAEKMPSECKDVIKISYKMLEFQWENYMQNGKIHPAAGVFLGVNNHGYHDVKQFNITPIADDPLGKTIDPETIRQKYLDAIPED